ARRSSDLRCQGIGFRRFRVVEGRDWNRKRGLYGKRSVASGRQELVRTSLAHLISILQKERGLNTSVMIKYPFWKRKLEIPRRFMPASTRGRLPRRSICISCDIGAVLENFREQENRCARYLFFLQRKRPDRRCFPTSPTCRSVIYVLSK